ncbi:RING-H2 finger protein ATL67 [Mercurialis annua]|uniref:RING-H2 finger protein ATL67 n=1 Tax=Mercurialis annua TaxID=3986 RepID=UPI0021605777|nr:RING-H2 finger protein ATL67 [Mercurialis annua]
MSTTTVAAIPTLPTTTASPTPPGYLTNLGLGYSIAIALGFLVLLSTILLASYICCRASRNRRSPYSDNDNNSAANPISTDGIMLPRIIFVAEDDDELERDQDSSAAIGLDQAVINSYPKFQFNKDGNYNSGGNNTCSICLCEYKDLEMLRMMPECRHFFHLYCLDAWLKLNGSCPVCRNSPLPTPLSTPLSEVVPLSQHAADRRRRR